MDKKSLSERDICTKFITPAIEQAGWNILKQVREEVTLTPGPIEVRGSVSARNNKKSKRADYILYYRPNRPIAIIEAKDNNHSVGAGMQQSLGYADILDIPFVFSSNGDGFLFHDKTGLANETERELGMEEFPNPEELWPLYRRWKGLDEENRAPIAKPFYKDDSEKEPRYYQEVAVNRTIDAIIRGQNRILLVMATGTGKTYTAFQIIWLLWKQKIKKRILFLVDRNILADQAKINDFKPFGQAMTKISNRMIDKSYEVYLALYQAVSGNEEDMNIYKEFSPDFFDLVVVDECHRGSAAEDAAWRQILEYFSSATQIGLTATPKETRDVSNIDYFGEPVYTYSLKQGINDGFLAPYKVVRYDLDRDIGWRPEAGQVDRDGKLIEDRIYNQKDYDRELVLEKRTRLVAEKVSQYLARIGEFSKTIVFCEDIDHAERMRQALVNLNAERVAENWKYVVRITGDEKTGKDELDNFIDPESKYPVIATTSKLMTTGVDAQTCKLIVIDQNIISLALFKQIIGRGTRLREDFGKYYFTIMDFRKATDLFADPEFDGEPISIYEPGEEDDPVPPGDGGDGPNGPGPLPPDPPPGPPQKRTKYYVNDVEVRVVAERVQYYNADGKLVTESLKDYTRNRMPEDCAELDDFLKRWTKSDRKQAVIDELESCGIILDALAEEVGRDYDPFDLICHIVFDQPPLMRKERANNVRKQNYFSQYGDKARVVLDAILEKYADSGIKAIEDMEILRIPPLNEMGTPIELLQSFGGKEDYLNAIRGLEKQLYAG